MPYFLHHYASPIGPLRLIASDSQLCAVVFEHNSAWSKKFPQFSLQNTPLLQETARQLKSYFEGSLKTFQLPLRLPESSLFQLKALQALEQIPYGSTKTYKEVAAIADSPKAFRAVGRCMASNLLCIVLPCHRVLGANNMLQGYAGGLEAKKFLLSLESHPEVC